MTPATINIQKSGPRPGGGGISRRAFFRRIWRVCSSTRSLVGEGSSVGPDFLTEEGVCGVASGAGESGDPGNGGVEVWGNAGEAEASSGTRNMARHPPQRTTCPTP